MTYRLRNIYTFDNNFGTSQEQPNHPISNHTNIPLNTNIQSSQDSIFWVPSPKFKKLYQKFQNDILTQWPRIACVYCGRLLYPEKASWVLYDPMITYPIQINIPNISLSFNPNVNRIAELRVPTCKSCKKPSTRFSFPYLSSMPNEIVSVPLHKRKHLSPVYLHCSLGRNPNSNPYSEYRNLVGVMNYSRNIRAHALYSGILGAFLEPTNNSFNNTSNNSIQDETLHLAATWLAQNNPYLRPFALQLFLTTDSPSIRTRTILPVSLINEDDENPYYDDTIIKYMSRPHTPEFDQLIYPQYFENYSITPYSPQSTSHYIHLDDLSNYVVKRKKKKY
ncbi:10322_t:CDS:2 [Gigaspora rosea]|nr:10322_t:CDS:2 [Gigaspora rosea]